jgi:hypothetical protein
MGTNLLADAKSVEDLDAIARKAKAGAHLAKLARLLEDGCLDPAGAKRECAAQPCDARADDEGLHLSLFELELDLDG